MSELPSAEASLWFVLLVLFVALWVVSILVVTLSLQVEIRMYASLQDELTLTNDALPPYTPGKPRELPSGSSVP